MVTVHKTWCSAVLVLSGSGEEQIAESAEAVGFKHAYKMLVPKLDSDYRCVGRWRPDRRSTPLLTLSENWTFLTIYPSDIARIVFSHNACLRQSAETVTLGDIDFGGKAASSSLGIWVPKQLSEVVTVPLLSDSPTFFTFPGHTISILIFEFSHETLGTGLCGSTSWSDDRRLGFAHGRRRCRKSGPMIGRQAQTMPRHGSRTDHTHAPWSTPSIVISTEVLYAE